MKLRHSGGVEAVKLRLTSITASTPPECRNFILHELDDAGDDVVVAGQALESEELLGDVLEDEMWTLRLKALSSQCRSIPSPRDVRGCDGA